MDELAKALNEKTLTIGTKRTLKNIEKGKAKKVFLANNCPISIKEKIMQHRDKVEIIELDVNSEELNIRLKKPFNIAVLSY